MSVELDDIEDGVDIALKADHAGVPSVTKCADLEQMSRIRNKVDALSAAKMTAFEATQEHRTEGHSSPVGWLKSHGRHEGRDAARWRRTSRFLKTLPLAREAHERGEITVSHVEALHRAQHLVGDEAFASAEELLVDAAVEQRFSDFQRTLEYVVIRVQPRDAESRDRRVRQDRFCSSSRTFGGNGVVDAQMPPVAFTIFDAELGRFTSTCWNGTGPRPGTASAAGPWTPSWRAPPASAESTPWC